MRILLKLLKTSIIVLAVFSVLMFICYQHSQHSETVSAIFSDSAYFVGIVIAFLSIIPYITTLFLPSKIDNKYVNTEANNTLTDSSEEYSVDTGIDTEESENSSLTKISSTDS